MNYEMIREAGVRVEETRGKDNYPVAIAHIGDKTHRFDEHSRVSKALDTMTVADLQARLDGGHYFFVEDKLVDFRDGHYTGWVHPDAAIEALARVVGINNAEAVGRVSVHKNTVNRDIVLGSKWSDHGIQVPGYDEGGEFTSELHFGWNPFVKNINTAFMLWRLICTNGMRGMTSLLNAKIPLVNRWEEHLDMANRQIQNKVDGMVTRRLSQMGTERATVAELQQLADHAHDRRNKGKRGQNESEAVRSRLDNIIAIANPRLHLGRHYKDNVFEDRRLGAQMPAHLSTFDAYNIATEIRTHTDEVAGSSANALDKFANGIVFDRKDLTQYGTRYMAPPSSSFSDPDAAFFGELH